MARAAQQSVSAVGCLWCNPTLRTAWLAPGFSSQVQSERSAGVRYFLCRFPIIMLQSWWYSCSANRDWQLFTLVLCSPIHSRYNFSFVLPLITSRDVTGFDFIFLFTPETAIWKMPSLLKYQHKWLCSCSLSCSLLWLQQGEGKETSQESCVYAGLPCHSSMRSKKCALAAFAPGQKNVLQRKKQPNVQSTLGVERGCWAVTPYGRKLSLRAGLSEQGC